MISDDQRWDMIGSAGNRTIKTPAIDRLAHEGVYFRQATAYAPQCTPSRATLLTGLPAHQHGLYSNLTRAVFAANFMTLPMLPRALSAAGYRTVFIGKWHVASIPTEAGFGEVRTWMREGIGAYRDATNLLRGMDGDRPTSGGYTNDMFADDAVAFLESDAARTQPFFLWLALTAPHEPYQPNPPEIVQLYAGKSARDLWPPPLAANTEPQDLTPYYEAVSLADRELGRVLDALDRRKLAATTLVVFVSDNGLMLAGRDAATPAGKTEGKILPNEASIRIPLVVRGPAVAHGVVNDRAVSTIDLPPTILAAAGVAPQPQWPGRDLGPALRGADAGPEEAFVEFSDPGKPGAAAIDYRVVRTPSAKLVVWQPPRSAELYDLVGDPQEQHNLIADAKWAAKRNDLNARLQRWLQKTDDPARKWTNVSDVEPKPAR